MPLFGKDALTYYSDTPLDDSNGVEDLTWTLADNIQDESDNFSAEEVDITTRATAALGWSATATTIKNGEVTFGVLMSASDPLVSLLMSAFLDSQPVTMLFLSGSGGFGLGANWSVSMQFPKPVKGVQTADVTLKVQSFPEWSEAGS